MIYIPTSSCILGFLVAVQYSTSQSYAWVAAPSSGQPSCCKFRKSISVSSYKASLVDISENDESSSERVIPFYHRRSVLSGIFGIPIFAIPTTPRVAQAKCTDIESCREIGEKKVEAESRQNPTIKLDNNVRYKVLQPGTGDDVVRDDSSIDLIYSISRLGSGYMYSQGFGFEKIDIIGDGTLQSDFSLDSLRVVIGQKNVPIGIEQALIGMKRGERRRVELPAYRVGFDSSDWKPEPKTKRGQAAIVSYRRTIEGNGPNQPPFAAATIWDIEVLKIRK